MYARDTSSPPCGPNERHHRWDFPHPRSYSCGFEISASQLSACTQCPRVGDQYSVHTWSSLFHTYRASRPRVRRKM
jgi:hypothetical protein